MSRYRVELDDLVVKKGEGMRGLVDAIDRCLLGGGVKIQPGTYRAVIERAPKDALTAKLEALVTDIRSAPPKASPLDRNWTVALLLRDGSWEEVDVVAATKPDAEAVAEKNWHGGEVSFVVALHSWERS